MIKIEKTNYLGWENSYRLSNGEIELVATTDIGPRIIHLSFVGEKNLFCVVQEQAGTKGSNEWKIYGGTRLWHSPEAMPRSYFPDNQPIEFEILEDGIRLMQPTETWTYLQKTIEVRLSNTENKIFVTYKIKNNGMFDVKFAVWALSVMAPGGIEVLPLPKLETGLLPSYNLVMWPYSKFNDHRVTFGEDYIIIRQDPNHKPPFKIGYPNIDGWAAYLNNNTLFVKYHSHHDNMEYPDFGCSYETYTTDFMLEMETLSPLILVAPGNEIIHTETWEIKKLSADIKNEEDVKKHILPLINK